MKTEIEWLDDALASKDVVMAMTHYRVEGGEVMATNGRLTAGHPCAQDGAFLVPGDDLKRILKRMTDKFTITQGEGEIAIKSGRFRGRIPTLPLEQWNYPGVDDARWEPVPDDLLACLRAVRPFISENATHAWALCAAINDGWICATNNVALACVPCAGLKDVSVLLPVWAIDFILSRSDGLEEWAWGTNFAAFRWKNGAWIRAALVEGVFPESAIVLVKQSQSEKPGQAITDAYRTAVGRIAELADDIIEVYADRVASNAAKSVVEESVVNEVPAGGDKSIWGARFLLPVLACATHWSPSTWPKPAPFKGKLVSGYIAGRSS